MVKSIGGTAIGVVLILVGLLGGAMGGLLLLDAIGSPLLGIGAYEVGFEMNGKLFHVDAGMACFVLLSISVLTTIVGGMMVAASLTRERTAKE